MVDTPTIIPNMKPTFLEISAALLMTLCSDLTAAEPTSDKAGLMTRLSNIEKEVTALRAKVTELEKVSPKPSVNGSHGQVTFGNLLIQWGVVDCTTPPRSENERAAKHTFKIPFKSGTLPALTLGGLSLSSGSAYVPYRYELDAVEFSILLNNINPQTAERKIPSILNWVAIGEIEPPKETPPSAPAGDK